MDKGISSLLAKKITENMLRLGEIWESLDYYNKYKVEKPNRTGLRRKIDDLSRSELIAFCWSIYPIIAKLKKQVKEEKDELKKASLKLTLQCRLEELEELKKIRDNA